ncbi:MAG: hypothetical protein DRO96_00780 [Candidatus Aenigmatarchaeota archaeon]|nr:MAG: hypothetical protein DRO96_00780 [Candidatus Aenigmarchaeota archaeon]
MKMFVVRRGKDSLESIETVEFTPNINPIEKKIISLLIRRSMYPREIAKALNIEQQKIYYHIRKMEKMGIVEVEHISRKDILTKFYRLRAPSFLLRVGEFEPVNNITFLSKKKREFLKPFVENGRINTKIVLGSPDPHGALSARARDGYYASDLTMFLGSFSSFPPKPCVVLDTEIKNLEQNMIIVGGPIVNRIAEKVNNRLPIFFKNKAIYSKLTKIFYKSDNCGIVVKTKNPFNRKKYIMIVAGIRSQGTRAAILAFLQRFDELCKGNEKNEKVYAHVVQGVDKDADGVIDFVDIIE